MDLDTNSDFPFPLEILRAVSPAKFLTYVLFVSPDCHGPRHNFGFLVSPLPPEQCWGRSGSKQKEKGNRKAACLPNIVWGEGGCGKSGRQGEPPEKEVKFVAEWIGF